MTSNPPWQGAWLAYGFRPFFLLAAAYAPLALVPWVGALLQQFVLPMSLSPLVWHGHEMLFGFAFAALAGFLLTAIPSWAGVRPLTGAGLASLVGLWLLGRVSFWFGASLPVLVVVALNLMFSLALLAWVLPSLLLPRGRRHLSLAAVLGAMVMVQAAFYGAWLAPAAGLPAPATLLNTGVNLMVLMVVLTLSRILPVVTQAARRDAGLLSPWRLSPARAHLAAVTLGLFVLADLWAPGHPVTGWLALAAAAAQADRLSEWSWGRAMARLYLLLLTLAYLWLVAGLVLVGLAALSDAWPAYAGRHALSVGTLGTSILAVFCIAGLRHTGRPLRLPRLLWPALLTLVATAALRTLVPLWLPEYYLVAAVALPFLLWTATFACYLVGYGRMLVTARPDGLPG